MRLVESWMLQIGDTRMGFLRPSLYVVIYYLPHSGLKMCKIDIDCILDANFLDCLALTFCDTVGDFLPEKGPRVRNILIDANCGGKSCPKSEKDQSNKVLLYIAHFCPSALMLKPISPRLVLFPDFEFLTCLGSSILLYVIYAFYFKLFCQNYQHTWWGLFSRNDRQVYRFFFTFPVVLCPPHLS